MPEVRPLVRLVIAIAVSLALADIGFAQSKTKKETPKSRATLESKPADGPRDYSSKNFLIHTDLPAADAQDLLKRMETMLSLISKYWARPPAGVIECWVVKDLQSWPEGTLPDEGRPNIVAGAGVTRSTTISQGNAFVAKARVYAVADRGTPLHEAVHAYCAQAFGRTGPVWYAEGMAEMGQYWKDGDASVNAHPIVIEYIRESEPKSLNEIVNNDESTGDSWQNYAWRWALCHLLCNNPNYAQRFRPLGLGLLTNQPVSFETVYGDMAEEISFEYRFFLKHVEAGYRVDLCAWDWKAKFKPNKTTSPTLSNIDAGRGWQPSKLTVSTDVEYEFVTSGTWTLAKDAKPVSADGHPDGTGKLLGVILTDDTLGEPFELGAQGTFTPPADGNLYLRCHDAWPSLVDNKGKVTVRLKMKGKGAPLVAPASGASAGPGTTPR